MKDGRITQAGKYDDILNSGTDFMELVGAHKEAFSGLDFTMTGSVSGSMSKEALWIVLIGLWKNKKIKMFKIVKKMM